MQQKHFLIEDVMSEDQCVLFERTLFDYLNNNGKITETKEIVNNLYGDAIGICNVISALKLHDVFVPILYNLRNEVKYRFGEDVHFDHSFARIYYKDSFLPIHLDDHPNDVTFSINISGLKNWGFYISNIESNENDPESKDKTFEEKMKTFSRDHECFYTKRGSAVLSHGRKYHHWRNKLDCLDNEYVLQLFLHFNYSN